jgi:fucose permease
MPSSNAGYSSATSEEARTKQPSPVALTLTYFAAFISIGLVSASLGPSLPSLAEQTHTNLSGISYLFTARALGYLLGSLLTGRLLDRMPGHPVLATMTGLMALTMALVPTIPLLWALIGVMLILGMAESGVDIGGNVLLVWVHRERVSPFMNGLHFFFGLGAFLSPVIIAQSLLLRGSIRWGYWLIALLMLPLAAWMLRLPSPANREDREKNRSGFANPLVVGLLAALFFLYVGAEVSFGGWIYTYTLATRLVEGAAGTARAATLTSAFWLALTVGRLLAIPVAARLRPSAILATALLGGLGSVALILWGPQTLPIVWAGTLGAGLFLASIFPTLMSFAERRMVISGSVTRWFFVGSGAGGMLLPWLIGQLFETKGPDVTMFGILACLLLALLVFTSIYLFTKSK